MKRPRSERRSAAFVRRSRTRRSTSTTTTAATKPWKLRQRPELQRHLFRIQSLLAAVREELPGTIIGLRDRNGDERARARASDAGRRSRDGLWRPAGRVSVQVVDLFRRLADPEDDCDPLPDR